MTELPQLHEGYRWVKALNVWSIWKGGQELRGTQVPEGRWKERFRAAAVRGDVLADFSYGRPLAWDLNDLTPLQRLLVYAVQDWAGDLDITAVDFRPPIGVISGVAVWATVAELPKALPGAKSPYLWMLVGEDRPVTMKFRVEMLPWHTAITFMLTTNPASIDR